MVVLLVVFGGEGYGDVHRIQRVGRSSGAEKAEVVAAKHQPCFGTRIGLESESMTPGGIGNERPGVFFVFAEGEDAAGLAAGKNAVDVDVELESGDGEEGILCVVVRAQEAAFFRRSRKENDGAAGAGVDLCEGAGELDEDGAAGGVIDGAVVDAIRARGGEAEVVPVGGVKNVLVAQDGV